MTIALTPTTDLIAAEWIRTIPGLTADGVGSILPPENTKWTAHGYVAIPMAVGGSPHSSMPVRRPVVQIDCWASNPGSDKIPWGKAAQLAEQIRLGTYDRQNFGRALTITNGDVSYAGGRILGAQMMTEPRRVWGDASDYAGYSFDLMLHWIAAGEQIP